MKNVFLVLNKEKIYAYVVSILTIITLFFMSSVLSSDLELSEETTSNVEANVNTQNETNSSLSE